MQQQQTKTPPAVELLVIFFTGEMTSVALILKYINKYIQDHGLILLI